ncbi:MAG: hypothetical protein IIB42_00455 [Candidatus Marinimicrobia bacterium]|nr:hypothetical protein [Candidatus Neomarinimicrobiota bacterium]
MFPTLGNRQPRQFNKAVLAGDRMIGLPGARGVVAATRKHPGMAPEDF